MDQIIVTSLFCGFLYSYIIYPFIMLVLCATKSKSKNKTIKNSTVSSVSIIVAVYNGLDDIEKKIQDLLSLRKCLPELEIIISSDCSNDGTDSVCEKYADQKLIVAVRSLVRGGKESAQLNALNVAKGEIIIFSDVSTFIHEKSLLNLLKYFTSPEVGAVSSQDMLLNKHGSYDMEGIYLKYEMWIRRIESKLAGCVGMSGSFFATRKKFCFPWNAHTCSDFNIAMNVARAGSLSISASDVLGFYSNLKNTKDEDGRRVRTVLRGIDGLFNNKEILLFPSNPLFAFQMFSHKLMRWLSPWFFVTLFFYLTFFWSENYLNTIIFFGQVLLLVTYFMSNIFTSLLAFRVFKIPVFFMASNFSILKAGVKFAMGKRMKLWEPSQR